MVSRWGVFLVCLLTACGQAHAPPTLSKWDLRHLEGDESKAIIVAQLDALLIQEDPRRSKRPKHGLSEHTLWTRPAATNIPGLCRSDLVTIEFSTLSDRRFNAHTPTIATGLKSQRYYFLSDPKQPISSDTYFDDESENPTDCANILPYEQDRFTALRTDIAANGYEITDIAIKRAQGEDIDFDLSCVMLNDDNSIDCPTLLKSLQIKDLVSIATCKAPNPKIRCFDIDIDRFGLKILIEPEKRIKSVQITEYLLWYHDVID